MYSCGYTKLSFGLLTCFWQISVPKDRIETINMVPFFQTAPKLNIQITEIKI